MPTTLTHHSLHCHPISVRNILPNGVQDFFFDCEDIRFHGRDERMGIQSFYQGQEILYDFVKRLCIP